MLAIETCYCVNKSPPSGDVVDFISDSHNSNAHRERDAEQSERRRAMQDGRQPGDPLLYSAPGFRYCDLLLGPAERDAWKCSHHAPRDEPEKAAIAAAAVESQRHSHSADDDDDSGTNKQEPAGPHAAGPHPAEGAGCMEACRVGKPAATARRTTRAMRGKLHCGPMRLYTADVHLYGARRFMGEGDYPRAVVKARCIPPSGDGGDG